MVRPSGEKLGFRSMKDESLSELIAKSVERDRKALWGLLALAATLLIVGLILFTTHASLAVSCDRSNVVRQSQLGEEQYAHDAAAVRNKSAKHEQHSDPVQAKLDREAAAAFLRDSKTIHVRLLDCGGLFPAER